MGCGQSKIHLYPRKSKSKANGKKSGHIDTDADADEDEGHIEESEKDINRDKDKIDDENSPSDGKGSPEPPNGEISVSLLRAKNLSLLQSQEISSSQQNFFRMLDQKIEEGPDYDSSSETEIALEEARLNALVQHWESASLTASLCSSASRSLQTTPVRQVPIRPPGTIRPALNSLPPQPLSAELLPHNALQPGMGGGGQPQLPGPGHIVQQNMVIVGGGVGGGGVVAGSPQAHLIAKNNLSPKREVRPILAQSMMHQNYGVPQQALSGRARPVAAIPAHMQMTYYGQPPPPPQSYFGEVMHPMQVVTSGAGSDHPIMTPVPLVPQMVSHAAAPEYRFPPAISVQRLAPQVQRQIRETQELIKDSCPQLYAAGYGSPGPPLRTQPRNSRRPTLETQYSQELS